MKLIDKDVLIEKIDKLVDKIEYHEGYDCGYRDGNNDALSALKEIIDTLELKEVDLEKEYKMFVNCDNGRSMFETAKHFFELGLKAQKKVE